MEERTGTVEYSRFLGDDTYTILMRTPNHFSKADSLIAPFSKQVWLVILLSSVLMGPILWVFINQLQPLARKEAIEEKKIVDSNADTEADNGRLSLKMCYWFVYGALLKQGFTRDPKSGGCRILWC